jgi:DNA-directed RNA polymerase specialized sigma24 family protein
VAEGFAQFVEARERALQRTAYLRTGDWALAEDLVQTSLARTWPRIRSLVTARLRRHHRIQYRSIRQWLQRRVRPANSNSHSPRFVKPFFSQVLLDGPFVTAGKA